MSVWTEVTLFVSNGEQRAVIQPSDTMDSIVLRSIEFLDKAEFRLYLSYEEAKALGKELIRYSSEEISKQISDK